MKKTRPQPLTETVFQALIENAHEGIALYDAAGRIVYVSKTALRLLGYTQKQALEKPGRTFIHPDDENVSAKNFRTVAKKPGKSILFRQRLRLKNGSFRWFETRLTNYLHIPEINGVVSNFRDITDSILVENEIAKNRELLETINQNLSEGIYMGSMTQGYLYVNDAFLKIFGFKTLAQLQRVAPSSLYARRHLRKEVIERLRKKEVVPRFETQFKRQNGEVFWGLLNIRRIEHEGRNDYYVGTIRDITKEKETEQALHDSQQFLTNIINTVAAPIFVKNEKFKWILFNKKFIDLIGEDPYGKTDYEIFPKAHADVFRRVDQEVLSTGTIIRNEEMALVNGREMNLLTVKSRYINERKEKFIIGFITDITHLREAEKRIRHLNANLRGVLESTRESIYALDKKLQYIAFNENHRRIMHELYGASIETGKNKLQFLADHPDRKWIQKELRQALKGKQVVSEHYLDYPTFRGFIQSVYNPIHNDAYEVEGVAVFITDITARKAFDAAMQSAHANLTGIMESTTDRILALDKNFCYLAFNSSHARSILQLTGKTIKKGDHILDVLPPPLAVIARKEMTKALSGKHFISETHLPDGRVLETAYNPITIQHQIQGIALFIRDVTLRYETEQKLKELNEELLLHNEQLASQEEELKATLEELSERNFELDQLMYKTSHDLRSPLSSILGLVNLAKNDDDNANLRQYLQLIEGRIHKLDDFIRSMLNYARVNRVEVTYETVDLQELITKCLHDLAYLESYSHVKVSCNLRSSFYVETDRLRLQIVFANILSNAFKYYNPEQHQSTLKITITRRQQQLHLTFEDNGIGIQQEHRDKIFTMFYRATDRSQGSGLGMYIVKQAVHSMGGTIALDSVYGEGTTIRIFLPEKTELPH